MDTEKEKKIIIAIEDANVKLKKLLNGFLLFPNMTKPILKQLVRELIQETIDELRELEADTDMISNTINGIKQTFINQYNVMNALVKKMEIKPNNEVSNQYSILPRKFLNLKTTETSQDVGFTITNKGMKRIEITNLRDFLTEYEEGAEGTYINYPEAFKNELANVQNEIAKGSLSMYDKNGKPKSIRNMAEIGVRYKLIQDDLKRLGNVKYVLATQHANASERCSWWQGKIFLVDFDVEARVMSEYPGASKVQPLVKPIGYIDGKPYYSLKTACENGFLSYNCQHRLVKYEIGMYIPKERDLISVSKRRDITSKQRYLEREIRQKETDIQVLQGKQQTEARKDHARLKKEYALFCEKNKVPRYDWRTKV